MKNRVTCPLALAIAILFSVSLFTCDSAIAGYLYSVQGGGVGLDSSLWRVDPADGSVTEVGPLPADLSLGSMVYNSDDGHLYGMPQSMFIADNLWRVDPADGSVTEVGPLPPNLLGFSLVYYPSHASADVLGNPPETPVNVTFSATGSAALGTVGMEEFGPDRENTALPQSVELDDQEISDALAASGQDHLTLRITYDRVDIAELELEEETLRPYWWDGSQWVLGGTQPDGDPGPSIFVEDLNSNPADYGLGYCGLNMTGDYVWVNMNHASQYGAGGAIVPEPATLSLLALGGLAMLRRRKRVCVLPDPQYAIG